MKIDHPYRRFEGEPLWKALDRGIGDLEANGDIELQTNSAYIIGYLCQMVQREIPGQSLGHVEARPEASGERVEIEARGPDKAGA